VAGSCAAAAVSRGSGPGLQRRPIRGGVRVGVRYGQPSRTGHRPAADRCQPWSGALGAASRL